MEIFGFVMFRKPKAPRYQYEIYERDISGVVWDLIAKGIASTQDSARAQALDAASFHVRNLQISTTVYIRDIRNNYFPVDIFDVDFCLEVQVVISRK